MRKYYRRGQLHATASERSELYFKFRSLRQRQQTKMGREEPGELGHQLVERVFRAVVLLEDIERQRAHARSGIVEHQHARLRDALLFEEIAQDLAGIRGKGCFVGRTDE